MLPTAGAQLPGAAELAQLGNAISDAVGAEGDNPDEAPTPATAEQQEPPAGDPDDQRDPDPDRREESGDEGAGAPEASGLDFSSPEPIDGLTPTGNTFTVESDSTRLVGNVTMSYVDFPTAQGPKPAIRIDADRVILDNLHVRFPGEPGGVADIWQRTGAGKTTTLNGHFHIVVANLSATPEIAGAELPAPVNVDASWAPEDIAHELAGIGAGIPDPISEQLVMLNSTMETYYIAADDIRFSDGNSIGS